MRYLLLSIGLSMLAACEDPPEYVTRNLTLWNHYVSNGYDNYEDEIEVNFRLESQGWFWLYPGGNRPTIYMHTSRTWQFNLLLERDSILVHARYFHTTGALPQIVYADTTIRMDMDKTLVFWNGGDTTATEFPFPAYLVDMDTWLQVSEGLSDWPAAI